MRRGDPCPLGVGECWECVDAMREAAQRLATGATVHQLNNMVMVLSGACYLRDRALWLQTWADFNRIVRQNMTKNR
jgi:hypothetical protein